MRRISKRITTKTRDKIKEDCGWKTITEQLGTLVREKRIKEEISMEQMSRNLKLSITTIWKIEKGDKSISFDHILYILKQIGYDIKLEIKDKKENLSFIYKL